MERASRIAVGSWLVMLWSISCGCTSFPRLANQIACGTSSLSSEPAPGRNRAGARPEGLRVVAAPQPPAIPAGHRTQPEAAAELSIEALLSQVLARNPSLAQMQAAWQAASARYPQVTSLDDPTFGATFGPE